MIHTAEKNEAREKAKAVLAKAKEFEARRLSAGAKYVRIDDRTTILKNDSNKAKPRKRKAQL